MKNRIPCGRLVLLPVLIAVLAGATGCACVWPEWWGPRHHDDSRGYYDDRDGRHYYDRDNDHYHHDHHDGRNRDRD